VWLLSAGIRWYLSACHRLNVFSSLIILYRSQKGVCLDVFHVGERDNSWITVENTIYANNTAQLFSARLYLSPEYLTLSRKRSWLAWLLEGLVSLTNLHLFHSHLTITVTFAFTSTPREHSPFLLLRDQIPLLFHKPTKDSTTDTQLQCCFQHLPVYKFIRLPKFRVSNAPWHL